MEKYFVLLVILCATAWADECVLEAKSKIKFPGKDEIFAFELTKLSGHTIHFYRQINRDHVLVRTDGSFKIFKPVQVLNQPPIVLKNGNFLLSSHEGDLFEVNNRAQVIHKMQLPFKSSLTGAFEVLGKWYATTFNGRLYSFQPKSTKFTLLFDSNSGHPGNDPIFFLTGPRHYFDQFIVVNALYHSSATLVTFLDFKGKKLFTANATVQSNWKNPLILKNGKVVVFGKKSQGVGASIQVIDPQNNFSSKMIDIPPADEEVIHIATLRNGGFVASVAVTNHRHYQQRLDFYNDQWEAQGHLMTSQAGWYDYTWSTFETSTGYLVNGVADMVQLISPDRKIVSEIKIPLGGQGSEQDVRGPILDLGRGRVAVLGSFGELFYLQQKCAKKW